MPKTNKEIGRNSRATLTKFSLSRWIAPNIVIFVLLTYAVIVNANDPTGFSFLFTFPIYVLATVLLILDVTIFTILAVRTPKKEHKRKAKYWLGAALSLAPIILTATYIFVNIWLHDAARIRANTPISLQEARQLVIACDVETLYRQESGSMKLNKSILVLPGGGAKPEGRTFNVGYFDEVLALARSKDVQDRCGFVPSYDAERSRQPEVVKWITKTEAEAIISKCLWSTALYPNDLYLKTELPDPNTTGILLSQRPEVWNDDIRSTITIVKADEAVKISLQERWKACAKY